MPVYGKEFWRHEHHLIAGSLEVLAQINRYRGEANKSKRICGA
ncbi:MAG: hypothetical protein AAGG02_13155 [Cyanobacteria bacterium P01_H01_bin.15]